MNKLLKTLAVAAIALCAVAAAPAFAQAQAKYPTQQVRVVVPFPPGGSTDALARLISEKLAARWKQTVIVENRPGANTMLGTDVVAKAPPDGLVLGIVTGSHVINPLLATTKMPYDTQKDLTGVMLLTGFQMALWAHPSFTANNPAELLALAKKEKVDYAAATTQSYLGMELLNSMAGVKLNYVPYKGSAQAMNDLMGGHVKLMIDPISHAMLEHVKSGKIKLIGTLGKRPSPLAPSVPTFAAVVPGYDFSGAFGLIAPAGTPPELVRFIRDEFVTVMKLPEVAERITSIGQEALLSTPDEYNSYIRAEGAKWAPIVKSTGATL
jgi:tripartite-type tricarboxylate transporter receptor subunit TctC